MYQNKGLSAGGSKLLDLLKKNKGKITGNAQSAASQYTNNIIGGATSKINNELNNTISGIGTQLNGVVDRAVQKIEAMTLPPVTVSLERKTKITVLGAAAFIGGGIAACGYFIGQGRKRKNP